MRRDKIRNINTAFELHMRFSVGNVISGSTYEIMYSINDGRNTGMYSASTSPENSIYAAIYICFNTSRGLPTGPESQVRIVAYRYWRLVSRDL